MRYLRLIAGLGAAAFVSLAVGDIEPTPPISERLCGPADIDGNSAVDVQDLLVVLSGWGVCEGECPGDICGPDSTPPDGYVDTSDLLDLLAAWGPCDS